jgi:hypothetical protein
MPGAVLQSVMPVGKTVDLKGLCSALTKSGKRCSRSGRDETVQRLSAMRDECWAELEQFRPAVEKALVVAEQHDSTARPRAGRLRSQPRASRGVRGFARYHKSVVCEKCANSAKLSQTQSNAAKAVGPASSVRSNT